MTVESKLATLLALVLLGDGLAAFLVWRSYRTEKTAMKAFDDLDDAVEAINDETTKLGTRIDEVERELLDAKGDATRVEAAATKLRDISARLKVMATTDDAGDVTVPIDGAPVPPEALARAGVNDTGSTSTAGGASTSASGGSTSATDRVGTATDTSAEGGGSTGGGTV